MYDNGFNYIIPSVENNKSFAINTTGRFLFYKKGKMEERLYVHLGKPEDSFYCIYWQINGEGYDYQYKTIEFQRESNLLACNERNEKKEIFQALRLVTPLSDDWIEFTGKLPHQEEIIFLQEMDKDNQKVQL